MTNLLVRLFVKNNEDYGNSEVRTAYGVLAGIVGIVCNVVLFIIKLIIGMLLNSITVIADAFNNLSDAASSIIGFVGARVASRPADKEHPFGHGRAEYVSALIVAFLVIQVGFTCFKSSFDKILHPELLKFNGILVAILVVSILIKVWLSMFNRLLGKKINSKVMLATAADARGDVIITSATVLSILIGYYTNLAIDGYVGVVVSILVLLSGFNIAKDTLEPLLGEAIDKTLYETITKKVESYEGIIGSHDLIVHTYGPTHQMATIHAEVPSDVSLESAHELIDRIEREVLKELDVFLVIHLDPVEVNNEILQQQKQQICDIIHSLEPQADLHDFRVVRGEHQSNLIFDLVVPYSYDKKKETELMTKIMQEARNLDSRYQCVITIENSFVGD